MSPNGQPYVILEDPSTAATRTLTVYRRESSGWVTVGAPSALARTIYNNTTTDLAFSADGTLWAVAMSSNNTITVSRFASAWEHFTRAWSVGDNIRYEGSRLTEDGKLCLFVDSVLLNTPLTAYFLDTW